jgi:lipoate-protein ligase A
MAADLAALEAAGDEVTACRVYQWNEPWVTLGRFQRPERDVVSGFSNWIKRPTGGKAVLHGHDLTVGLAMPLFTDRRSVRGAYQQAVSPLVGALRACGLEAELATVGDASGARERTADCFAASSGCDVVAADGNKVCGCALLIRGNLVLLQASVPYKAPLVAPGLAITGASERRLKLWRHEDFASALESTLSQALSQRV